MAAPNVIKVIDVYFMASADINTSIQKDTSTAMPNIKPLYIPNFSIKWRMTMCPSVATVFMNVKVKAASKNIVVNKKKEEYS